MEDRKRPGGDDLGPPTKRHQANGTSKSRDEDRGDEAWIEVSNHEMLSVKNTIPLLPNHTITSCHFLRSGSCSTITLVSSSSGASSVCQKWLTYSVLMHGLLAFSMPGCQVPKYPSTARWHCPQSHPELVATLPTQLLESLDGYRR